MLNNCLAFICNASNYLGSRIDGLLPVGSTGCVLIGYLTLYTFTSFMFWINAMAANIFSNSHSYSVARMKEVSDIRRIKDCTMMIRPVF